MAQDDDDMLMTAPQPADAAAEGGIASLEDLIATLATPKQYAARLAAAEARIAATAEATAALATAEAAFTEHEQKTLAELSAEDDALLSRIVAAKLKPRELEARRNRLRDLDAAWAMLGEPPDVVSGFRAAELTALEKAKRAYGLLPAAPAAVDNNASAIADPAVSPAFSDFEPIAGSTITRGSQPRSAVARSRLRRTQEPRLAHD